MQQNHTKIANLDNLSNNVLENNKYFFKQNSVVVLKRLVSKKLIDETLKFLEKEETSIISNYFGDKRGLVVENINNNLFIKYFEHPLALNFALFGRFITTDLLQNCKDLLEDEVYLRSVEIHCRNPGGSSIPMHQDNSYYGLTNGKACTIFIPLNKTNDFIGDLTYIKNKVGKEYSHDSSNESAFSLEINPKDRNILKNQKKIYKSNLSDGFVHHSHSVHYADSVPRDSIRTWAVRITLFGLNECVKAGHHDWYNEIVKKNRTNARL